MGQEFMGVYATSEAAPTLGEYVRPAGRRKRLWFVWKTSDGCYIAQALNAICQPMAKPRAITFREFELRFTPECGCPAVPEGYGAPAEAAQCRESSPLPDLFSPEGGGLAAPPVFHGSGKEKSCFRADDPDLLRRWVFIGPEFVNRSVNPANVPFDRLVGDVEQKENTEPEPAPCAHCAGGGIADSLPEEARLLRKKFVEGLLLLRRGEREASVVLLQNMLAEPHPPFEGAPRLYSEFGLGLRRLGLAALALVAHKRALDYAPEDERILFNIARSCHDLGLLAEAKEYLEKALVVAPGFASAERFRAFLEAGSGKDA